MEYRLSCGDSSGVVTTAGGEMLSFRRGGVEIAWRGLPEYWHGHAPVLFPTVGSLRGNQAEIGGKIYPMQKHGFARKSEFEAESLSEDSARFVLRENEQTLSGFPFSFELRVTHTVSANGFSTEYRVKNTGNSTMPFGIGGHQGFSCPMFDDTVFSDYSVVFGHKEEGPVYYTRLEDCGGVIHREDRVPALEGVTSVDLAYPLFDRDVVVFTNLRSRSMKLVHRSTGRGVEFSVRGFSNLGIWSPPGKKAPFVCLEPWTVTPDFSDGPARFEEKPGITLLAPGAEFSAGYGVSVL